MDKTEKRFERDIETFLISNAGGYTQFVGQDENGNWVHNFKHDVEKCIYLDVLIQFIEKTQPKAFEKYKRYYQNNYKEKLYSRLEDTINDRGLIYVLKKNVLPYNPLAYLDRKKDKIGYEIPFTRLFYKFVPPTPSEEIFNEIKTLELEELDLMKELFGDE